MSDREGRHPIFARCYARMSRVVEEHGMADLRREALADLRGDVVEVGAGNGLNFAHYPATVRRVVAVEPEPYLRERAAAEAADATVPVTIVPGRAEALPLPDGSFDGAVTSIVLCSVDDQAQALAEVGRVLRPGGSLAFLEHVRASTRGLALVQRALDATVWPWFAGGCHTARRTAEAIEAAGFEIERLRHLRFPDTAIPEPTSSMVLGLARR